MSKPDKKLFLLDAYALIYRAHFAFTKTPRINSKGINTSVPFGFTNTLLEVLQKQKPTHIAIAFDTTAKTFRDEIFKEYKATRQETPEDIRSGIPIVKEIIRGFNIPIVEMDGYEADDIIGTLAAQACTKGFEVFMMTPDKDFGQLVTDCVFLYKPAYMGNAVDVLGPKEVCEKWDIENVSQVRDMLGLQGDSSDNIPGIPGFGPKTAAVLLKQYGSVENIVAHASELKGKQKDLVLQFGDQAILSKKLATIITDVPVEFNEIALAYSGPDPEKLKPIFNELEFKAISARAFGEVSSAEPIRQSQQSAQLSMFGQAAVPDISDDGAEKKTFGSIPVQYSLIENNSQLQALVEKLKDQPVISIDTYTDEASNFDFSLRGMSVSCREGEAYFLPLETTVQTQETLSALSGLLQDSKIMKVGFNIKSTILALKKHGVTLAGQLYDPMLAHYLIEPEASHDLAILCSQYLN
ncbi:MAG: DNA polymerase I, partial [Marivirga sp.]|nr:DNA polymerase I [Marivirga sp.]